MTPRTQEISNKEIYNKANNSLLKVNNIDTETARECASMSLLQKSEKPLFIRNCTYFSSKSALKTKQQNWKKAFHCLNCFYFWRLLCSWRKKFSPTRKERIINFFPVLCDIVIIIQHPPTNKTMKRSYEISLFHFQFQRAWYPI